LEEFVCLGANVVQLYVNLQPLARAQDMGESGLAMNAQVDDAAGDPDGRLRRLQCDSVGAAVFLKQLQRVCRPVKFVGIRFMPARLDLGKLFLALEKLVDWILR
jgi:hypothetical protein